jgi:shikimate kinase
MKARPIVLVGLMASGKTTVGRLLADRLSFRFVDLDEEIERQAGASVEQLWQADGESGFRKLEARTTRELAPESDTVVATGGGWMANIEAREAWPEARTVWLMVSPSEAARRVGSETSSRPLLGGPEALPILERLNAQRLPAYGQAMYTVDTIGLSVDDVVAEITRVIGLETGR